MTRFADGIESGLITISSATDSRAAVQLTRTHRFTGGGNQTWNGVFPSNTQGIDANIYIIANGSATTSDTITLTTSAGTTPLGSITAIGSATGLLRVTTAGLGVLNIIASAAHSVGPVTLSDIEVPFRVVLSSVDTATDYRLELTFRRSLGVF